MSRNNYISYNPEKSLHTQLKVLSSQIGITIFEEPYRVEKIRYKTLKINEIYLELSLKVQTYIGTSREHSMCPYNSSSFTIKSKDSNKIDLKNVLAEDIEKTITEIFQLSVSEK